MPGAELFILAPFFVTLLLGWVVFFDADRAYYLAAHHPAQFDPIAYAALRQGIGPAGSASLRTASVRESLDLCPGQISPQSGSRPDSAGASVGPEGNLPPLSQSGQSTGRVQSTWWPCFWWAWFFSSCRGSFAWSSTSVRCPRGNARQRLMQTARRLHFRCSDLLLWNTQGGMANAMVLGIFPWPRYVVFTDRMLEEFSPEEVEAVFGHEIGHVKHRHMLLYLVFISASIVMLTLLTAWLFPSLADPAPRHRQMPKTFSTWPTTNTSGPPPCLWCCSRISSWSLVFYRAAVNGRLTCTAAGRLPPTTASPRWGSGFS